MKILAHQEIEQIKGGNSLAPAILLPVLPIVVSTVAYTLWQLRHNQSVTDKGYAKAYWQEQFLG